MIGSTVPGLWLVTDPAEQWIDWRVLKFWRGLLVTDFDYMLLASCQSTLEGESGQDAVNLRIDIEINAHKLWTCMENIRMDSGVPE